VSTRLAVISDLHGDVRTLQLTLAQIERLGCDLIVCAGDIVGIGTEPDETVALLRERGIPCIRGNHDLWALKGQYTVTASTRAFLEALPPTWRAVLDGVRVAVCHGTPRSDMELIHPDYTPATALQRYLEQADADVLLAGHAHLAFSIGIGGNRLVANPGLLMNGGTFGVLELPRRDFTVHGASDGAEVAIVRRAIP
jgi:putative phosphoesterase